ncbi:hypothetical protein DOY81_008133 [Sarcophaga bullata]|nr:hypothetical protein DOY81_008133 [Sarcophaga bullata]
MSLILESQRARETSTEHETRLNNERVFVTIHCTKFHNGNTECCKRNKALKTVFGAPQGYEYKRPTAVLENNYFQTLEAPKFLPCTHSKIFNGKQLNLQSEARILNHKSNQAINQNFVTSESGYNSQSQHSSVGNDGNVLTHSIPPVTSLVPNFVHSGTVQQIQPSAQSQGYIYNQATSNAASSVSAHHNFINSEQNIQNPNTPAYATLPLNSPEVVGINFPYLRPDQSFNGEIMKDHNKAGYAHVTSTVHSASSNKNIQQISNGLLTGDNGHFVNISGNTAFNQDTFDTVDKNIQYVPNVGSQLNLNTVNGQLGQVIREISRGTLALDSTVEKHIYVHVPPQDDGEEYQQKIAVINQIKSPPRKHYKIIFIKAPSYPTPDYSQLANAVVPQVDEKTLVYVLVKKAEVPTLEHIQQLQQSSFKASKPEVYFIKYKTRKEGESNQHTTNAQNDICTDCNIQINDSTDDIIDIRSNGEGNAERLSTSYSSPLSETIANDELKHELYGVPLQ